MEVSDEILMKGYQEGNTKSFQALYDRYLPRLMRFFEMKLGSKHKAYAEDLFQTTWLKVHSARKAFDPNRKFSPWIYQIAINSIRDHVALSRFAHEITSDSMDEHHAEDFDETWKLEWERMKADFMRLPSSQREVLFLAEIEGFSFSDIAEILGISDVTARQMASRARRKLQESVLK